MAHIPGLYLKPESFSPSYGRKKMTDTRSAHLWRTVADRRIMQHAHCGIEAADDMTPTIVARLAALSFSPIRILCTGS